MPTEYEENASVMGSWQWVVVGGWWLVCGRDMPTLLSLTMFASVANEWLNIKFPLRICIENEQLGSMVASSGGQAKLTNIPF